MEITDRAAMFGHILTACQARGFETVTITSHSDGTWNVHPRPAPREQAARLLLHRLAGDDAVVKAEDFTGERPFTLWTAGPFQVYGAARARMGVAP